MFRFKFLIRSGIVAISFFITALTALAQQTIRPITMQPEWTQDYRPFQIVGNVYYVGSYDLACYLITTPQGHILINEGVAGLAPMIRKHIEELGFKFTDIKILLTNQAHFDHVGDLGVIKKQTGAQVMVDAGDAEVLADGGNSDYVFGGQGATFEPVKADRLLHDQDLIKLGNMQIEVLHHPGHTKGSCSFLFNTSDGQRTWKVLIANMPSILDQTKLSGMPGYPQVGSDYAYTLKAMKNLHFDIWLAAHSSQFDLQKKHHPGEAYNPAAFVDHKGYDEALNTLQMAYDEKLREKLK